MQPNEEEGQIFVIVIDETYGGDEETWEEDSENYRKEIEAEFSTDFAEANVGPGADIPAFLTILTTATVPLWSLLVTAFFLGKPINENLEAWGDIGRKLRGFFGRPVILARHGASVIAVEAVFEEMGGMPKTIQLLVYRPAHIGDTNELLDMEAHNEINETPDTLYLGYCLHVFEIEADGQRFRVSVDGKNTQVLRLK